MVSRNDLRARLKAKQPKPEPINVDGWGEGFYCRKLNGLEKYDYYIMAERISKISDETDKHNLNKTAMVFLISRCVCDENGDRIWLDEDDGDIASQEFDSLLSAFTQCCDMNGIQRGEKKEAAEDGA